MPPKTKRASTDGSKPLPLRTGEAEKMRKPTARLGLAQPSDRGAGGKGAKPQPSDRPLASPTAKSKAQSSQPSQRGSKKQDAAGTSPASPPKKPTAKPMAQAQPPAAAQQPARRASTDPAGAGGTSSSLLAGTAASNAAKVSAEPSIKIASTGGGGGGGGGGDRKKIDYLTEELMSRTPLDDKSREVLVQKCGPPKQEVHHLRNEGHQPRPDDLAPSRHERVPPSCVVLMFNCCESSFDLAYGDLSTLPESETTELRSLTSNKVLGRVKVTPEKGTHREKPRTVLTASLLHPPTLPPRSRRRWRQRSC
jgi:hypothetical protein